MLLFFLQDNRIKILLFFLLPNSLNALIFRILFEMTT